jgi:hypothetical protein
MKIGDVWRSSLGRLWLVTVVASKVDPDTYGLILDVGENSPFGETGTEECLADDCFAEHDWSLVTELHT